MQATTELNRTGNDDFRAITFGLVAYFLVSVILRVALSGTADMDETELLVHTQTWRPGYGAQLPLYAWLQRLVFSVLGVNIIALSLLKFGLLFFTYICVLRIAGRTLKDSMGASAAALSLFLIPQIAWESYRTLTHTVLATLMAAVTLLILLRLRERATVPLYLLLGAAAGLGMLSKYNYALFLLSLMLAGLSVPVYRRCLISVKSLLSIAIMTVITAPSYIWIAGNLDRATASSKKLQTLDQGNYLIASITGLFSLIAAWIGYFWPVLAVYGIFYFLAGPVRETFPDEEAKRLIQRFLVTAFTLCTLLILFFKVTYFKERWMQPLLFFLPVYFMYHLGPRLDRRRCKVLLTVVLVPALLAMATFSGSVLLASKTGRATRLTPPYRAMAGHIRDDGFTNGTIITDDHRIGGNFRLSFKGASILVQGMMEIPVSAAEPALVLWNADKSETPPRELVKYAEDNLGTNLDGAAIRYVEKPMLYWEEKKMKLGYIIIEGR